MANEDYNICHYVKDRGTSGLKKAEYWQEGFKQGLWRPIKTASSLRNRYRFYVKFLMADDLKKLHKAAGGTFNTIEPVKCSECGQTCSGKLCKACEMKKAVMDD